MSVDGSTPNTQPGLPKKRRRLRQTVYVILGLALLAFALESGRVLFGSNFHTVIPGQVYRCAQPSPESLTDYMDRYHIRTVINLRGCCPQADWYQKEARATCDLDLAQEDLNFSAGRMPSSSEIRRLVDVLDRAQYPVLIHCRRGSDRTGLVSTIIMLRQEGVSLDDALGELHVRFGHIAVGRTWYLDHFFEQYRDWLAEQNVEHSPGRIRHWLLQEYRGGAASFAVDEIDLPKQPIPLHQPFTIKVKLRNTSAQPWEFRAVNKAGLHGLFVLYAPNGQQYTGGRFALLDKTVPPGETIDLAIPVHSVKQPGTYRLVLTILDEQQGDFTQLGNVPFEARLLFREK